MNMAIAQLAGEIAKHDPEFKARIVSEFKALLDELRRSFEARESDES